jgi:U3 small nucleolar RNA-associated protein 4
MKHEGQLFPRRVRNFSDVLKAYIPRSETSGSTGFVFTPDSSKLIVCTSLLPYVLVVDLSVDNPKVLRRFDQHCFRGVLSGGRVVKTGSKDLNARPEETELDISSRREIWDGVTILQAAISSDGQWLATSDDRCRTQIYNLDALQVETPMFYSIPQTLIVSI